MKKKYFKMSSAAVVIVPLRVDTDQSYLLEFTHYKKKKKKKKKKITHNFIRLNYITLITTFVQDIFVILDRCCRQNK